ATPGVTGRYSNHLSYNRSLHTRTLGVSGLLWPSLPTVKRFPFDYWCIFSSPRKSAATIRHDTEPSGYRQPDYGANSDAKWRQLIGN
ncbi:hypothetical protein, partial [Primorskyibacter sedentarius]|uniref:hypothetical protein n=1 Tax=Primorskyibacter sedentarius TaxID=745311 RepID=UPI003EBA8AAB